MMRVVVRGGSSFSLRPIGNNRTVISVTAQVCATATTTTAAMPTARDTRCLMNMTTSQATNPSFTSTRNESKSHQPKHTSTFSNRSRHFSKANVFLALTACLSLRPIMTMAEESTSAAAVEDDDRGKLLKYSNGRACPAYGCPLFPLDIVSVPGQDPLHNTFHAPGSLAALTEIREKTRQELLQQIQEETEHAAKLLTLETTARQDMATMTMTGFKGGTPHQQINQDRAMVVGPYYINDDDKSVERRLLGVFDGHATRGEIVSEYVVKTLPNLLAQKLREALSPTDSMSLQDDEVSTTKRVLHETFLELDRTAPADPSGGCTATVVLQQGLHVYIANAGDSQSLIGIYRANSKNTTIAHVTREDKPDLPEERARVEAMGGYVYIPVRGTSRVVWVNPQTGAQTGLAMSRSLGDWTFGKIGVIPDPTVDVLYIPDLISQELKNTRAIVSDCWTVDDDGVVSRSTDYDSVECREQQEPLELELEEDDVYIFAVSATDGMLDYVTKEGIAQVVAHSLFDDEAPHPATACELLVSTAAQGWEKYRQGRYRDDIAIAISVLRTPPSKENGDDETASTAASSVRSDEL